MSVLYQKILDSVEVELKEFSSNCLDLNASVIVPSYNFDVNFCNERTVSYYISNKLISILQSYGIVTTSFFCEINISLRHSLLPSEISLAKSDSIGADRAYGTWFMPDTYLRLQISDDRYLDSFIEFKNSNNYKYLSLANDFLKYKFYTVRSMQESLFVFVILNRTNSTPFTPTLLNGTSSTPVYQIITPPISASLVNPSASVFFIHSNSFANPIPFPYSPTVLKLFDKLMMSISKLDDNDLVADYSSIANLDENHYYQRKGKFSPNVLESHIIQKKYKDILEIYKSISIMNDSDIVLPVNSFITIQNFRNPSGIDADYFTNEITKYFGNQIQNQLNRIEGPQNKYAFKRIRRRSLWIILLIDKFSKDNNLGFDLTSNIGSEDEIADCEKLRVMLKEAYENPANLGNFNKLCLGMIFYIVNLYKLLFVMPDGEVELNESNDFKAFKEKKNIQSSLVKILASLDLKNTFHVEWNTDINALGKSIVNEIISKSLIT